MIYPPWLTRITASPFDYMKGYIEMASETNESNEAYERRVAAGRLLIEAPIGARFEYKRYPEDANNDLYESCSVDYVFALVTGGNIVRISPAPKKVLRPAWEILRLCVERDILKISGEEDEVLEIELPESRFNFSDIVYWSKKGEVPQWAARDKWPDEWFTTEEPKR